MVFFARLGALVVLSGAIAQVAPPVGCPTPEDLSKNLVQVKTLSGYYLGYSLEGDRWHLRDAPRWLQGTKEPGFAFDWNFTACPSSTNYNLRAARRNGGNDLLVCSPGSTIVPGFGPKCYLNSENWNQCDDHSLNAFQVRKTFTNHCALQHHSYSLLHPDVFLCEADGKALPELCSQGGGKLDTNAQLVLTAADPSGNKCDNVKSTPAGTWAPAGYSSVPNSLTMTIGVDHSYSEENTQEWGISARNSLEGGFEFAYKGASGNIKDTIDVTVSYDFAKSFSSELEQSESVERTQEFGPGQVWQFQLNFTDQCGSSIVKGPQFALTPSRVAVPCCLPGYAKDPAKQHGDCLPSEDGKIYSVCKNSTLSRSFAI